MEELGDSLPNKSTRVMLLVTEDWFVLSHFQPLVRALVSACGEVVVVTTSSGRLKEIEALGARVIAMDFARASVESGRQMAIIRQLRRLIIDEAPAIVHAISLKPVGLAGLALRGLGRAGQRPRLVMHLTGTGPTGRTVPGQMPPAYIATIAVTRLLMRLPDTSLIVENPDDAARIAGPDWAGNRRVMIIGGAGIDPSSYITARRPEGGKVVVGYLGRMLWTKGVGHLVDAVRLLHQRRADLELLLGGTPDGANRWSIPQATLDEWATLPGGQFARPGCRRSGVLVAYRHRRHPVDLGRRPAARPARSSRQRPPADRDRRAGMSIFRAPRARRPYRAAG